jgi:hypothetical protein
MLFKQAHIQIKYTLPASKLTGFYSLKNCGAAPCKYVSPRRGRMRFREFICDTPIETIFIGSTRLQLVPSLKLSTWRVFCWPALLGELIHERTSWRVIRDGKVLTEDKDRRIALTVLVLMTA